MKGKYLLFCLFLFKCVGVLAQQPVANVCDSVFLAIVNKSAGDLQKLTPGFSDLRSAYDSSDVELMLYQIGIRQKDLEYTTRRDMKRMIKFAKKEKIQLDKLQKLTMVHPVSKDAQNHEYSYAHIECQHGKKYYTIYFTLIKLNEKWFYGEALRIERKEVPESETPNYEAIDREREKKKQDRENARIKEEEDKRKAEEAEKKRVQKEADDKLKAEEEAKKLVEKEQKEKEKIIAAERKQDSLQKRKELKVAQEKLKAEEKEKKEQKKEEAAKKKKEELKAKEKEKEEAAKKKKAEQKAKEKEKEEAKKKKKEDLKAKEKEKKDAEKKKKEVGK